MLSSSFIIFYWPLILLGLLLECSQMCWISSSRAGRLLVGKVSRVERERKRERKMVEDCGFGNLEDCPYHGCYVSFPNLCKGYNPAFVSSASKFSKLNSFSVSPFFYLIRYQTLSLFNANKSIHFSILLFLSILSLQILRSHR